MLSKFANNEDAVKFFFYISFMISSGEKKWNVKD